MWNSIDTLPDFNGRVTVRIVQDNAEIILSCWYETGNRRFPQGFSLLNPRLIPFITEWKEEERDTRIMKFTDS